MILTFNNKAHVNKQSITAMASNIFFRPERSQGLLYKHLRHSLIQSFFRWLNNHISPLTLQRRHAQGDRDNSSSYKIDYLVLVKIILNLTGYHNSMIGSKVMPVLLKCCNWPIGGVASWRVCGQPAKQTCF